MFAVIGCSAVNVAPVLNSSLSMAAFEKMKKIEPHNVKLALYIEPKMKELQLNQNLSLGRYTFDIGNAFSAKLIKALSYNFKNLYFYIYLSFIIFSVTMIILEIYTHY